ncbi:MAG TPA: exopolysaccharide biosynthesis polyprenyl glycosylphosphotransferase, partial [Candidatus Synoicihabitans sp.]|nr:exopolysaccharide biosynthesis polyprenyl glycosylphosphotransferase [Candidatus Synoicihabitans sp.]
GWAELLDETGWITFNSSLNLPLYAGAVFVAACWMQELLRNYATRLGTLDWLACLRLSRQQVFRVAMVLFALVFMTQGVEVSRIFLGTYLLLLAVIVTLTNMYLPPLLGRLFFGGNVLRTVVLGLGEQAHEPWLCRWVSQHSHLGLDLVGFVGPAPETTATQESDVPWLGQADALPHILAEHQIAQLVISPSHFEPQTCRKYIQAAEDAGCRVRVVFPFSRMFEHHPLSVEQDGDNACVTLTEEPLDNPVNGLTKRLLDIAISVPVVVFVLPPLTLAVWLMQRRQAPGPIFHRQLRAGRNRRPFLIYKFRTMYHRTDRADERVQATRHDSRVYPFGRFLRRTSLDEIPQFLNVLLGEMSVNGPRPHLLEHDAEFASVVGSSYHRRHFVKPGITGLAQSHGFRGEISSETLLHRRLHYDMLYIMRWSLALELKILLKTARQILFPPRTAY